MPKRIRVGGMLAAVLLVATALPAAAEGTFIVYQCGDGYADLCAQHCEAA